jgi:uncharacterized protein
MLFGIMLFGIMFEGIETDFLDRQPELDRLERLVAQPQGALAVLFGRRRIGKTRLLLEWVQRTNGLYVVADQSSSEVQRRYVALALATRLSGFADVEYRDWWSLLVRLARDAQALGWRGPIVIDELPYLALAAPELPSLLQRFVDHEARQARLILAVAGSSQRMMQGLVLDHNAPLFGRAQVIFDLGPIPPLFLRRLFPSADSRRLVELHAAWGGVPHYWEMAKSSGSDEAKQQILELVLDPHGPLHQEPDRLLLEELPSAVDLRPVLDVIGAGCHRVSEIAGRLNRPATSLPRPLERLRGMGLVRREVPFGENEKESRRSLYRLADPFFRLWFRVVAPHRGQLVSATPALRLALFERFWPALVAEAFEELCRAQVPLLDPASSLGALGPWKPASRYWHGNEPEWDIVAESFDEESLLLGEVKCREVPVGPEELRPLLARLAERPAPRLGARWQNKRVVRALFVPSAVEHDRGGSGPVVVTVDDLVSEAKGADP